MTDYKIKNGQASEFSLHPEVKESSGIALKRDLALVKKYNSKIILRKFYEDIEEKHFILTQLKEQGEKAKGKDFCAVIVYNINGTTNARLPVDKNKLQSFIEDSAILNLYSENRGKGFK